MPVFLASRDNIETCKSEKNRDQVSKNIPRAMTS